MSSSEERQFRQDLLDAIRNVPISEERAQAMVDKWRAALDEALLNWQKWSTEYRDNCNARMNNELERIDQAAEKIANVALREVKTLLEKAGAKWGERLTALEERMAKMEAGREPWER
jgi:dsDNA-specific endonuclease/ATPase MutS2